EEEPAPPPKRRQVKRRSYGPAHYKDSERKIKISRATIKSKIHDSGLQVANDALILLQKILQEEDDRIVERAIAHTKAKRKKRVVKTHVHAVRE
ncbi:MAG TPA: hypothetical protein VHD33_04290, partial [Legionellaceae bacterium]|nr:hypothetical protein [Legionellaceae bacterium]